MAKKLTVTTDFGTFTRKTDRTYTHLVIVDRYTDANLAHNLASERERLTDYVAYGQAVVSGQKTLQPWESRDRVVEDLARWQEQLANLDATYAAKAADDTFTALGWCGRLDLARKLAAGPQANHYRTVKIIDVATGQVVR